MRIERSLPAGAEDDARPRWGDPRGRALAEAGLPRLGGEEEAHAGPGKGEAGAEADGGEAREVLRLDAVRVAGQVARPGGVAVRADVVPGDERAHADDAAQDDRGEPDARERDAAREAERAGFVGVRRGRAERPG